MSTESAIAKLRSIFDDLEAEREQLQGQIASINARLAEIAIQRDKLRDFILDFSDVSQTETAEQTVAMGELEESSPDELVDEKRKKATSVAPKGLRNAILEIFREQKRPLHHRTELIPLLERRGMFITSENPAGVVGAHLSNDSRFIKTPLRPGYWQLASWIAESQENEDVSTIAPTPDNNAGISEASDTPEMPVTPAHISSESRRTFHVDPSFLGVKPRETRHERYV